MPRAVCPHCGLHPTDSPTTEPRWPEDMDLTQVHGPKGQMAWREAIVRNRITGAISPEDAKAYSVLIDGAARAKTPTAADGKGKAEQKLAQLEALLWADDDDDTKAGGPAGEEEE